MSSSTPLTEVRGPIYIADWLIEPTLNQISRQDTIKRLEPKAMNVLMLLAAHPNQVLSKDDLLTSIWSDAFVTEHVLVRVIWQLRQALGDDVIQTIPKRGYRLTAPVRDPSQSEPPPLSTDTTQPDSPRRTYLRASIAAMFILLAIAGVFAWRSRAKHTPLNSLAVLPLANYSGDPSQDYLADALTEELTTDLSKISRLRVISRTSSMKYKGTKKTVPEIARELDVDAVLEGSIQRVGSQLRLTVQLVQAANEKHLWAESYTRDLTNFLVLRDELASSVANAVNVTLSPADRARLNRGRTNIPEAHEAYLHGRHLADRGDWRQAVQYFEDAVNRDPKYALAWADLAEAYGMSSFNGRNPGLIEKRLAAIVVARDLDPELPEVHDLVGDVKFYRYHLWAEGQADYRHAIESDRGSVDAQYHYALSEWALGQFESALIEMRRAQSLDPLSPVINNSIGHILLDAGHVEEAIVQLQRTIRIDAAFIPAYLNLSAALEQQGRNDEAVAACLEALKLEGFAASEIEELRDTFHRSGLQAFHHRHLQMQLSHAQAKPDGVSIVDLAAIHAGLGNKDLAFKYLDEAFAKQVGALTWLKVRPEWKPLRNDPRYHDLMQRMKLPE